MDDNNKQVVNYQDGKQRGGWFSLSSWVNWHPWAASSMAALAEAEKKILASMWNQLESKFVPINNGTRTIRTISLNKESKNTPLVLLHGMGSGVGLWILNLSSFAKTRPVFALDVLGFGLSSRPKFSKDAMLAEMEFVESVEEWRKENNLDKFVLLGHSLGGFLASSYAIRYPDRIRHLILVDPWGFPERPMESEKRTPIPIWIKVIGTLVQPFNPFAVLRAAGRWGPGLVAKFRSDLTRKFSHLFDDDTVSQYVYHCNAQTPSGEAAFKTLTEGFGWAKFPMINRVNEIPAFVPMTVIYGSRSWVDSGIGWQIKYIRSDSFVDVQVVKGAGHHVYADRADLFNLLVNRACLMVDQQIDRKTSLTKRRRMRSESSPSLQFHERSKSLTSRNSSKNLKEHTEQEEGEDSTSSTGMSCDQALVRSEVKDTEKVKFSIAEEDEDEDGDDDDDDDQQQINAAQNTVMKTPTTNATETVPNTV